MGLYAVLRRKPRSWWLWGAAVVMAFEIVGVALGPVFIAPIFNKFTPVHDEDIRRSVLAMNHVWQGIAFSGVGIVLGFLFVRWAFAWACARWPGMGVPGIGDVDGLPLFLLLLSLFLAVAAPVINTHTRALETQADQFGLDASGAPDAAATVFLKLGEYRDLDPHPFVERLLFDHPSGRNRIRHAMDWKAAHVKIQDLTPSEGSGLQ